MSSLDHLIDLAQRTGDRLIVHNPVEDRDVVIMGVDEYERIIDDRSFDFTKHDVRRLTSDQMLDQINRDISIWRADKEMDEEWENEMILEDEYDDLPPFDPFSEVDYHPAEWHTAADVLENKFKDTPWSEKEENKQNYSVNIEEVSLDDEIKHVPFKQEESEIDWTENDSDDDEPVFYEEPV